MVPTHISVCGAEGELIMEVRQVKISAASCVIRALSITIAVFIAVLCIALLLANEKHGVLPYLLMEVATMVLTVVQAWSLSRIPTVS